jgi:uncharacterized integral membrane protein
VNDEPHSEDEHTPAPIEPDPLRPARGASTWLALTAVGVLLVLLVVFILQNTQSVRVSFLGWDGDAPLAVALLASAAAGVLVTALAAIVRILRQHRRVRREARRRD